MTNKKDKKDTVLIVDDMDMNRMILESILCDDYDVLQADNGLAAVDLLFNAVDLPAVVLLDIMMPEMDGFEVMDLIKSNTRTAGIPVVFITAADIESTETRGLRAGAVGYRRTDGVCRRDLSEGVEFSLGVFRVLVHDGFYRASGSIPKMAAIYHAVRFRPAAAHG
jgi:CheY-like chemotaxis protein